MSGGQLAAASNVCPSMGSNDQDTAGNSNSGGLESPKKYPPYSQDATKLETIMKHKLSVLAPHSLNYGIVCIYRVPDKHRKKNPEAYTPRLVSIGPLHYGQSQLQRIEEYKLKYLYNFLHTFRVPLGSLTEFVHAQEKLVHVCYENNYVKNLKKPDDEEDVKLSEVMLLDGVFILELFLKNHFHQLREMGDLIFDNPWVSKDIVHDLLLLENQLPLKFVSSLYESFVYGNLKKLLEGDRGVHAPSFFELVLEYFQDRDVGNTKKLGLTQKLELTTLQAAQHLVEFLAILHTRPEVDGNSQLKLGGNHEQKPEGRLKHRWGHKRGEKSELTYCPTVTQLSTAGVQIIKPAEKEKEQYLFEVHFDKDKGELTIPPMVINDSTETFLRNLIAFEQTGYHSKHVTSYVILLDNFIDTEKDVQLLMKHEILKNELRTNEQVADVFNNLYQEVVTDLDEFTYLKTCKELDEYSKNTRHALMSWWANARMVLATDYFKSPWSGLSVCGAVFVILLTIMQSVVSLLGYLNDQNKL